MLILYTDLVNLVVLIPFALHIVRNMLSSEGHEKYQPRHWGPN